MTTYKVTYWGWESRYLGETICSSLAEAKREAKAYAPREALSAQIRTPRGKFHHVRLA